MPQPNPELLVAPDWLETHLDDPNVRVFDCTLTRIPQPTGASIWQSGKPGWQEEHIPGAGYFHMVDDLSSPSGSIPYGLPPAESIARLLSSFGVTGDDTIVLYGAGPQSVVHRCWWVLTASGARDVRVLDGGWERWRNEGRPVESAPPRFKPGTFAGNPKPDIKADRDDVVGALGNSKSCLVHALTAEQFAGTGGQVYGKPGRIPGSVHVPVQSVVDAATNRLRPIAELEELFSATGADKADVVIPYCGGGIAASTIFLALSLVGYDNVRLYDGSLLDWTADPDAPMVTDANAASAN